MEPVTEPSDATGYFGSQDEIVDYINLWMQDGSPREIARAVGDVARSRGLTGMSPKADGGGAFYAGLSGEEDPTLETLAAVLDALGIELSVRQKAT
jgi:probable addiction module antidote protein